MRDTENPRIPSTEWRTPQWARILPEEISQENLCALDLIAHNGVGLARQIEVTPGMIADLMSVLPDFGGALRIFLCPFRGDEESARYMGAAESRDEIGAAVCFPARIERESDLPAPVRPSFDLECLLLGCAARPGIGKSRK